MTIIEYGKRLSSLLALAVGLSFASGCKPPGEEGNGNGNGYDGGLPPAEQCLSPQEFAETTIYSSTKICPGTYRDVSLRISTGTDDVALRGKDVTLDGLLAGTTAISAENAARLTIEGFHLKDYAVGARLKTITDSTIKLDSYSNQIGGTALQLSRGLAVVMQGGTLEGAISYHGNSNEIKEVQGREFSSVDPEAEWPGPTPSTGIKIIGNTFPGSIDLTQLAGGLVTGNELGGITMPASNNVTLENNTIKGDVIQEEGTSFTIRGNTIEGTITGAGDDSLIENNTVTRGGISGGNNLVIRGNTITGTVDLFTGSNNTVENNTIQNGDFGILTNIYQGNQGSGLKILFNTIKYHSYGGIILNARNSLVEGNTVTDNVGKGLDVGGCGNTIKNNDLRNNGEGNELYPGSENCSNTYEGNLE